MEKRDFKSVPNVVIWAWMRTVLHLAGSELMVFAYIFSQTFDNVHKCFTCLADMELWFGMSRQTISRNFEKLKNKGYIIKETLQDQINPMIKHNNYRVDVPYLTKLCEESDYDNYRNFLDSYGSILKQKFPEDSLTIDEYLESLSTWHKNKNMKVCITLNELAQLICMGGDEEQPSIVDVLETLRNNNKKTKKGREHDYIEKDIKDFKDVKETKKKSSGFDFSDPEPKKKRMSKQAKQAAWHTEKQAITHNAVYMRLGGNAELYDLLNKFLDTDNGRSYTPIQWEQQIDSMIEHGRTIDRMIEGVKRSFMNNYRTLYIVDKSEVDISLKLKEIDKYVKEECDGNEKLKDLLTAYVLEVPKGKSYTVRQFNMALDNLSELCPTTEEKIKSVERSYANSYAALAYEQPKYQAESQTNNTEIDTEEKSAIVDEFIKNGYYYLCDGLEEALRQYLTDTTVGRSMTASAFKIILDNLRLYCLDDADKIAKVRLAIQNNSSKFATEDFKESQQIKDRLQTRESLAANGDRTRKLSIIKEKARNPKNPKVANITV